MVIQVKAIMFMLVGALMLLSVVGGLGIILWRMGVNNAEIRLSLRYEAQENVVETTLFKMQTTVKNMHACIEGQTADFTRQQNVLTDIWREHTAFCKNPFNNMLGLRMTDKVKPKPEMITSQEAKDGVRDKKISTKLF